MLLAHTSGLLNFAYLEPDKKLHLHFKPGTKFNYSGEGINLVQFVIEQKSDAGSDLHANGDAANRTNLST